MQLSGQLSRTTDSTPFCTDVGERAESGVDVLGDSDGTACARRPRHFGEVTMEAQVGDRIKVESHRVGGGQRIGEIVEIVRGPGGQLLPHPLGRRPRDVILSE